MLRSLITIDEVIQNGLVHAVFQPIVDLRTGAIVAHEALARGPRGSALESPAELFAAAATSGLTAELDAVCLQAAFVTARASRARTLFVNVEPETFTGPPAEVPPNVQIVAEVTERGLSARPAELLEALERARLAGWEVAVDDVGADWHSLAMLPVLGPSVIKLDRAVLAQGPTRDNSRMLRAARAQVDRRGGLLLAEGIEDQTHAQRAIGFGASLGQGFHLGRPAPLIDFPPPVQLDLRRSEIAYDRATPFEILTRERIPVAIGTKQEILPLSRDIELSATEQPDPCIIMGTFQTAKYFTDDTRARYADLACGAAYVAVFGVGIEPRPAPGVTGSNLAPGEQLADEWIVVAIGPHMTSGLIARDLGDKVPDLKRRFEYALLSDREIVERAARSLMLRISANRPLQADPDH